MKYTMMDNILQVVHVWLHCQYYSMVAATTTTMCLGKRSLEHKVDSGNRLSVTCSGNTSTIIISREEHNTQDVNVQVDYYCYSHNYSEIKRDVLIKDLQNSNSNGYNKSINVIENSICIFVGCVEKKDSFGEWYIINGNGSNCTNDFILDEPTSTMINELSTSLAYTVVASNAWNSTSLLSENTPSLSPAATTSTKIVYISSSLVDIESSQEMSSSIILQPTVSWSTTEESIDLSTTSDSESLSYSTTNSDAMSTPASPATDPNETIVFVSIGIGSFAAVAILIFCSSLLIICCTKRLNASSLAKHDKDFIIGATGDITILPDELLKCSPSAYTIYTDPMTATTLHFEKQIHAVKPSTALKSALTCHSADTSTSCNSSNITTNTSITEEWEDGSYASNQNVTVPVPLGDQNDTILYTYCNSDYLPHSFEGLLQSRSNHNSHSPTGQELTGYIIIEDII